jgi:hypothetical protein
VIAAPASGRRRRFSTVADEKYLDMKEDPPGTAALPVAYERWLEEEGLAEPEPPGASGPDLISAARDAAVADDLSRLSDAELVGQIRASRDLASRATGRQYRAQGELLRRRPPRGKSRRFEEQDARRDAEEGISGSAPGRPQIPVMPSEEAAGELALALTLTDYSAGIATALTADLICRLPCALRELETGRIDELRARIIWEYSRDLSDEGARGLDAALSPLAGSMTTGELRDKSRREQIRIDPAAAETRRKRGERGARVVVHANDDHTANMGVEHGPADLAAAARARVSAIARAQKTGGAKDNLGLLEAKTFFGLLLGTLGEIPDPMTELPLEAVLDPMTAPDQETGQHRMAAQVQPKVRGAQLRAWTNRRPGRRSRSPWTRPLPAAWSSRPA